jgi:hypothetical protein
MEVVKVTTAGKKKQNCMEVVKNRCVIQAKVR